MRRRDFIVGLGGATAWSVAAQGQRADRMQRIGILVSADESDSETKDRLDSLKQALEVLGWFEGRNLRVDYRFASGRPDRFQLLAKELVALNPNTILAHTTPIAKALKRESSTIPIVFNSTSDPVGSGLIASLARPGGNLTGLLLYEEGIIGKWLAMLKEVAPNLARAAMMGNPETTPFDYFIGSARVVAPSLAIEVLPSPVANAADIERSIESFAQMPSGGLVLVSSTTNFLNRNLIIDLAARHRLPTVYPDQSYVMAGGLMSYGVDMIEHWRRSAYFIDRILRGDKPSDLPVEAPTKYETVFNLKTAKAVGLTIPETLLATADEVIQ